MLSRIIEAMLSIPVILNGDITTPEEVAGAFAETGCDGVMVGRGAIQHPWLFREPEADNHRFRFEEYLTDELVAELSDEQRRVLWLEREFELDPIWAQERERELGRVRWSTVS